MGISLNTVKSLKKTAYSALRDILGKDFYNALLILLTL